MTCCKLTKEQLSQLVELADEHKRLDQYIAGYYEKTTADTVWAGGCAIGCTIHDAVTLGILPPSVSRSNHGQLGTVTGVPESLWRLVDAIFEGLSKGDRLELAPAILRSLRPGVDYTRAVEKIKLRILIDAVEWAAADADQWRNIRDIVLDEMHNAGVKT